MRLSNRIRHLAEMPQFYGWRNTLNDIAIECQMMEEHLVSRDRKSKPEPPPVPEGDQVAPALLADLMSAKQTPAVVEAIVLVRARDTFGQNKYGQPLMTRDGRNTIEDLRQEIGDAMLYAAKGRLNGEPVERLAPLVRVLLRVVEGEL